MITERYFLFLIKTICFDSSSEPFHRHGSDEGSQYVFYVQLTRIITKYSKLSRTLLVAAILECHITKNQNGFI